MCSVVFLDKDGTIIPDIPYNVDPSLITLCAGVGEGLQLLQSIGYQFVVISNQSGVALGYFNESGLDKVFDKISSLLKPWNVNIKAFYCCPHLPTGVNNSYAIDCDCRKPMPGLIIKAAQEMNIDLNKSWMIGDILNDVEAGNRAGCKSILIDNGNETEWLKNKWRDPNYSVTNFFDAAKYIKSLTKLESYINA